MAIRNVSDPQLQPHRGLERRHVMRIFGYDDAAGCHGRIAAPRESEENRS
jgi:hypothetical protein